MITRSAAGLNKAVMQGQWFGSHQSSHGALPKMNSGSDFESRPQGALGGAMSGAVSGAMSGNLPGMRASGTGIPGTGISGTGVPGTEVPGGGRY